MLFLSNYHTKDEGRNAFNDDDNTDKMSSNSGLKFVALRLVCLTYEQRLWFNVISVGAPYSQIIMVFVYLIFVVIFFSIFPYQERLLIRNQSNN